jgi:hypothetical protein
VNRFMPGVVQMRSPAIRQVHVDENSHQLASGMSCP